MSDTHPTPQTTSATSSGYRKKPIWIYVTAFALMFSPLGNLLYSLASMKVPGWYKPSVWIYWARFVTPSTWALLGLLFVAGCTLLFVRRWSWTFSMGVLGFILLYDLAMIRHFLALGPAAVIAMFVGTLSFGLILYFSEFRKPYLNPRVRWWETSPRYKVALPVSCGGLPASGTLIDISRTGLLVEWPEGMALAELTGSCEITLKESLKLPAEVKRRTKSGYGFQFTKLSKMQKKALLDFLDHLSVDPVQAAR